MRRLVKPCALGGLLCGFALWFSGCRSAETPPAANGAAVGGTDRATVGASTKPAGTKAVASGTNDRSEKPGGKTSSPAGSPASAQPNRKTEAVGKTPQAVSAAKPTPTPFLTQVQGTAVIRALNAEKTLQGHAISVGIMPGSGDVSLDGKVETAAQRALAEKITRRVLPKAKITNRLAVKTAAKAGIN